MIAEWHRSGIRIAAKAFRTAALTRDIQPRRFEAWQGGIRKVAARYLDKMWTDFGSNHFCPGVLVYANGRTSLSSGSDRSGWQGVCAAAARAPPRCLNSE